mgnify:CR=1 FL=1
MKKVLKYGIIAIIIIAVIVININLYVKISINKKILKEEEWKHTTARPQKKP